MKQVKLDWVCKLRIYDEYVSVIMGDAADIYIRRVNGKLIRPTISSRPMFTDKFWNKIVEVFNKNAQDHT